MRTKLKMWRNGRGGKWTRRITWYEDDHSIRLKLDDEDGTFNWIFEGLDRKAQADAMWEDFKAGKVGLNDWLRKD